MTDSERLSALERVVGRQNAVIKCLLVSIAALFLVAATVARTPFHSALDVVDSSGKAQITLKQDGTGVFTGSVSMADLAIDGTPSVNGALKAIEKRLNEMTAEVNTRVKKGAFCRFKNVNSRANLCIDVLGGIFEDARPLVVGNSNNTDAQKFQILDF